MDFNYPATAELKAEAARLTRVVIQLLSLLGKCCVTGT
jgi:hypothetical protein